MPEDTNTLVEPEAPAEVPVEEPVAEEVSDAPDAAEDGPEEVVKTKVTVTAECAEGGQTVVRIETPNADNVETVLNNGETGTFEVGCEQKLVVLERDAPSSTSYAGAAQ